MRYGQASSCSASRSPCAGGSPCFSSLSCFSGNYRRRKRRKHPLHVPGPPGGVHGLSPRVRGNQFARRVYDAVCGSIPACAGEPRSAPPTHPDWRVYPRVCGGTELGTASSNILMGLSPRVRGNLLQRRRCPSGHGSIPACAGEPAARERAAGGHEVYPRVCGGTTGAAGITISRTGLSPRVRGNHRREQGAVLRHGSIPACAGEPRT